MIFLCTFIFLDKQILLRKATFSYVFFTTLELFLSQIFESFGK